VSSRNPFFKLHGVTFQKTAVLILNPALFPSRLAFLLSSSAGPCGAVRNHNAVNFCSRSPEVVFRPRHWLSWNKYLVAFFLQENSGIIPQQDTTASPRSLIFVIYQS